MEDKTSGDHYKRISNEFNELWEYSDAFISWMTDEIQSRLAAARTNRIVDLGGGTGIYSIAIADRLRPTHAVLCVDPSAEMLENVKGEAMVRAVQADALSFLDGDDVFDRVFMKEVIHHLDDQNEFAHRIYHKLPSGGVFVLALLPPAIEYPLFSAALRLFESLQPDYRSLETMFRTAGFSVVSTIPSFQLRIEKDRYHKMVRSRYMSLLSSFSDTDLELGLQEMEERDRDQDVLEFNDRFVFMSCVKP